MSARGPCEAVLWRPRLSCELLTVGGNSPSLSFVYLFFLFSGRAKQHVLERPSSLIMRAGTTLSVSINGRGDAPDSRSNPTLLQNLKTKLLIHIGLVLSVSTQVLNSSQHSSGYNLAVNDHWRSVLSRALDLNTTSPFDPPEPPDPSIFLVTSESQCVALMRALAQTYFELNSSSLDLYSYLFDHNGGILPIEFVTVGDEKFCDPFGVIRSDSAGILDPSQTRRLSLCFRTASKITLYARYLGLRFTKRHRFCVLCQIELNILLRTVNQAKIHTHCRRTKCFSTDNDKANARAFSHISYFDIMVNTAIFILAMLSLVPSAVVSLRIPGRRTAMRLVCLIGDAFGIFASLINLFVDDDLLKGVISRSDMHFLFGVCALICWIRLVRYMELIFGSESTALIRILLNSLPEMTKILIGSAPILIGLALAGMALFADQSSRFSSFGFALQSIFAMANGDYVQEAFRDTDGDYGIFEFSPHSIMRFRLVTFFHVDLGWNINGSVNCLLRPKNGISGDLKTRVSICQALKAKQHSNAFLILSNSFGKLLSA